nr:CAP domain-containing protein [Neobacillus sp. Marseille-Q6967]
MIKKPIGLVLSTVLTMGLAACNNNNDAADEVRTSRADRDNNIMNVGNNRDDGIDHNGMLSEDYTNNDNNDSDIDRGNGYNANNRRDTDRNRLNVNNRNDNNRNRLNVNNNRDNRNGTNMNNENRGNHRDLYNVNNDRDFDWTKRPRNNTNRNVNNNNNNNNLDLNISSMTTNVNSRQYPHTKAVLIQDARYHYVRIDPKTGARFQVGLVTPGQLPNLAQGQAPQAPNQQQPGDQGRTQQPGAQGPTQQPRAQAPAQQPAAPAPAAPAPAPAAPKAEAPAKQPATQAPARTTGDVDNIVQQVIDLTNAQRKKNGLPALKADAQLNGVAQKKSADMAQNNYFSHTSPTYGSPFDMMRDFGVSYKSAGENIAQGQRTPQEVVNAWMNSEGHRKNILSRNFTHIGVGYEKSGHHWTQMFIGR